MRAGKYFGIVYNKNILVIKIIQDVAKMLVFDLAGMAVNDHHSGIFTFFCRVLGNKIQG